MSLTLNRPSGGNVGDGTVGFAATRQARAQVDRDREDRGQCSDRVDELCNQRKSSGPHTHHPLLIGNLFILHLMILLGKKS